MRRVTILSKNGNSKIIGVPRDILAALRWKQGDGLALFVVGDCLVVRSVQAAIDDAGRVAAKTAMQIGVEEVAS